MSKLRMTEQQQRERALKAAIARAAAEQGLEHDKEIAAVLGISPQSYCHHKKTAFQGASFELVARLARTLRLTGRDLCAVVGVAYDQ